MSHRAAYTERNKARLYSWIETAASAQLHLTEKGRAYFAGRLRSMLHMTTHTPSLSGRGAADQQKIIDRRALEVLAHQFATNERLCEVTGPAVARRIIEEAETAGFDPEVPPT